MHVSSFYEAIDNARLGPVYLLCGDSEFLISRAISYLEKKFQTGDSVGLNIAKLDAEESKVFQVIDLARTPPLFGKRRLVIVKNVHKWLKNEQESLLPYLKNPPLSACLVLVGGEKAGVRTFATLLDQKRSVVELNSPRTNQLVNWLKQQCRVIGKTLSIPAAMQLQERVGTNLRELDTCLKQLSLFVENKPTIDVDDVRRLLDDTRGRSIFELTESLGNRAVVPALTALRNLFMSGQAPLMVLHMISRQFRLLWQVKSATKKGKTVSELAEKMALPKWIAKKYMAQARKFTLSELETVHELVRQTDLNIKTSVVSREFCIEILIINICSDLTFSRNVSGSIKETTILP